MKQNWHLLNFFDFTLNKTKPNQQNQRNISYEIKIFPGFQSQLMKKQNETEINIKQYQTEVVYICYREAYNVNTGSYFI